MKPISRPITISCFCVAGLLRRSGIAGAVIGTVILMGFDIGSPSLVGQSVPRDLRQEPPVRENAAGALNRIERSAQAMVWLDEASAADKQGDYAKAFDRYEDCRKAGEALDDIELISAALRGMGMVHRNRGEYEDALRVFERLLQLHKDQDPLGEADARMHKGSILMLGFQPKLAIPQFETARNLLKPISSNHAVEYRRATILYGLSLLADGQHELAMIILKEVGVIFPSLVESDDSILSATGEANSVSDRVAADRTILDGYRAILTDSIESPDPISRASALVGLAAMDFFQGDVEKAFDGFSATLKALEQTPNIELEGWARTGLGVCFEKEEKWESALAEFSTAATIFESIRDRMRNPILELSYGTLRFNPYYHSIVCLAHLGRPLEALHMTGRGKARTLNRMFQSEAIREPDAGNPLAVPASPESSETDRAGNGTLNSLPARLREFAAGAPVVYLDYVIGDVASYVIVVDTTRPGPPTTQIVELPLKRPAIQQLVGNLRIRMERVSVRGAFKESEDLYEALLAPVESFFKKNDVLLCIAPDDVLWKLPFQALSRSGVYLLETHPVVYVPSLQSLPHLARSQASIERPRGFSDQFLVMAHADPTQPVLGGPDATTNGDRIAGSNSDSNPNVRRSESIAIPGERVLLDRFRSQFGDRILVATGAESTENLFKTRAPLHSRIFCFVHGQYDPLDRSKTGLFLASDPHDDGFCSVDEIMGLTLRADLVFLAACESGRGRIHSGEGILGLSWALLSAGSASNVLTLWKVAAESTVDLSTEFFRQLEADGLKEPGGFGKARALQQAQLSLLRDPRWRHPYHWAPFVLVGSWK